MILYNDKEKREMIMDYYLNPKYKKNEIRNLDTSIYQHSSSCVDEIKLNYEKENNFIEYKAKGCAVFLSACEIFIERFLEVGIENKDKLINNFINLVEKNKITEKEKEFLGKLIIYENVKKHLNRLECALLITKVFDKIK